MAITRAQQYKQMLQKGGRIGLANGAQFDTSKGGGPISPGTSMSGGVRNRDGGKDPSVQTGGSNTEGVTFIDQARKKVNPFGSLTDLPGIIGMGARFLTPNPFGFEPKPVLNVGGGGGGDNYSEAMIDIPTWMRLGFSSEAEYLASLEDEEDEKEDEGLRLAFRADGGRIGLQEGGGIEQRLEKLGGDVSSAEQMLQGINQRLKTAESSLGSGGGIGGLQQPAVNAAPFMGRPALTEMPGYQGLPPSPIFVKELETAKPGSLASLMNTSSLGSGGGMQSPFTDQGSIVPQGGGLGSLPAGIANNMMPQPSLGVPTGLNRVPEGNMPTNTSMPENVFMGNMNPVGGPSDRLIPLEENPNFQNIPEQFRSGFANYLKENPNSFGFGGQRITGVGLPGGGSVMFGDTGSAGAFRDYLESTGFTPPGPIAVPTLSPLNQIGQPQAVQQAFPGISDQRPMGLAAADGTMSFMPNPLSPQQQMEQANAAQEKFSPEERVRNAEMSLLTREMKTPQQLAYIDRVVKSGGTDYLYDLDYFTNSGLRAGGGGRLGIPAVGFADGGNVVGGEYDFESARQMYGLGKLVKKVTRTVKKIAKSPIGKAALLYTGAAMAGSYGSGQGFFSKGMFNPGNIGRGIFGITAKGQALRGFPELAAQKGLLGKLGLTGGYGSLMPTALGGIVGTSIAAGLLTPKQELLAQELAAEEGIDIEAARNSILARAQGNVEDDARATFLYAAEGGSAKEPVAKKTMPLLDMGGQEMDLRDNGGFVPIGRMEKADDVPARLSKNEFVFTADAVRNAGDGDVDKGAEVMYNMMKNLEAGGEVSEESQGLEGARKMFQTSQRLEEVL